MIFQGIGIELRAAHPHVWLKITLHQTLCLCPAAQKKSCLLLMPRKAVCKVVLPAMSAWHRPNSWTDTYGKGQNHPGAFDYVKSLGLNRVITHKRWVSKFMRRIVIYRFAWQNQNHLHRVKDSWRHTISTYFNPKNSTQKTLTRLRLQINLCYLSLNCFLNNLSEAWSDCVCYEVLGKTATFVYM